MIPVAELLRAAGTILNDYDRDPEGGKHVQWTEGELIDWINEGAPQILVYRPAAGARTETLELVAGALQDVLPEGGVMVLDVVRNLTADGKPARAIRRTDRSQLDDARPDWYAMPPADSIRHYCTDDRSPKTFYCYPPAKEGVKVEVVYAKLPPSVASPDDTLELDRIYQAPLVSYMVYRALAKDSEYANGQMAAAFYQAFVDPLGAQSEAQGGYSPKGVLDATP